MDGAGNLYGTTQRGGAHGPPWGLGTVFELTPNAARTKWTETVLHSFCAQANCVDGSFPSAGLIMDGAGNLYGTTQSGGAHRPPYGLGTVFELTPNAARTKWTETVLYSFCSQAFCRDGRRPQTVLIMDGAGNLYGTSSEGGAICSVRLAERCGTVFELTPNAARTKWTETVLYSFCAQANCVDGSFPSAGLIMDGVGNLYGTTPHGHAGVVFELMPNAARTAWTDEVLYRFCLQGGSCSDGDQPSGSLIMDKSGNLYGTTQFGGDGDGCGSTGCGTVFALKP
jgi:uncharacterized repeat protein (TIGR03803 family)